MKNDELYDKFMDTLKEQVPHQLSLTNTLMDILCIGREAIYRRLRGEVAFTFSEIAVLAKHFEISIDQIMGSISSKNMPFRMNLIDYGDPFTSDYQRISRFTSILKSIKDDPDSVIATSSNVIPHTFYLNNKVITNFKIFKWLHHYDQVEPFSINEVKIPDKLDYLHREYAHRIKDIKNTTHILDKLMFVYLVNDVKYFVRLNLISKDDTLLLKENLFRIVDELEEITFNGRYENGNKVNIYISELNFEATYSYLESHNISYSHIRAFALDSLISENKDTMINLKRWINSLKKFSILISESAESQRIKYFNDQRQIIDSL